MSYAIIQVITVRVMRSYSNNLNLPKFFTSTKMKKRNFGTSNRNWAVIERERYEVRMSQ